MACDYKAVSAQGADLFIKDPITQEWLYLAGLTNFNGPQTSVNEVDATALCSKAMTYIPGLPDYGTFTGTAHTLFGNPAQWLLSQSMANTPPDTFELKLRIPDDGYDNGEVWGYGRGFCNGFPVEGSVGAIITSNISIRLTGAWTWERPTAVGSKLRWNTTNLTESGANNGAVVQTVTISLQGDTFTGTAGQPLDGVTFTGSPTGLTPVITKVSSTAAILSFTGAAADHDEDTTDVIQVVFGDEAFTTGPASGILNNDRLVTINWI